MKLSHEKTINVRNIFGLGIVLAGATIGFSVDAQSGGATGGVSLSTAGPSASATVSAAAPPAESSAPPYLNRYIAEDNLWELGLFGGLMFPSSSHNLREPGRAQQPFKTAGELGARIAYFPFAYLGAEIEGAALPSELEDGSAGGLLAGRVHLIGQLPISSITPFALLGGGALGGASTRMGTDGDPAIHFGVGAKAALDEYISVRLDVRDTLTQKFDAESGAQTHHPEVLLGLTFTLERNNPDADGDRFADHRDDCPAVPGANHGCPAPDQDRDGIADDADQCKDAPGVAPTGCPDADGDGRLDAVDACPDQAAATKTGCPERDCNCADTDGDGRQDTSDKCPTVPAATADGCPIGDTDGDGIKDDADKCKDKPETPNGFQDADGCPDEVPAEVQRFSGVIRGIEFAYNSAEIRPASKPLLDDAAKVLQQHSELQLEIVGHTDSQGARELNLDLSRRRAESVKAYLVGRGVAANRLQTRGMGPDQPLADNATDAGKQQNRRIEFKIGNK